jgi:hypothetical protein
MSFNDDILALFYKGIFLFRKCLIMIRLFGLIVVVQF